MGGYALSELPTEAMAHEAQPRGWCPTLLTGTPRFEHRHNDEAPTRQSVIGHMHALETLRTLGQRNQHRVRKTVNPPPDAKVMVGMRKCTLDIPPPRGCESESSAK